MYSPVGVEHGEMLLQVILSNEDMTTGKCVKLSLCSNSQGVQE